MFDLEVLTAQISKKEGFLICFPNKSGLFYRISSVDPKLQTSDGMKDFVEKNQPVVQVSAVNGVAQFHFLCGDDFSKKAEKLLLKYGVMYLLANEYISEKTAIAVGAKKLVHEKLFSKKEAAAIAAKTWEKTKATLSEERQRIRLSVGLLCPAETVEATAETVEATN